MVVLFLVAHLYIHSSRKPSKKIAKSIFGRIFSKTEGRKKPMQKKKIKNNRHRENSSHVPEVSSL